MSDVRPFANGFEYYAWIERNCGRCVRFTPEPTCEIEEALALACLGTGTISREIADRVGYAPERIYLDGHLILGWPCAEFEARP